MSKEYNQYLKDHIDSVQKAWIWMAGNLNELIPYFMDIPVDHDKSKFTKEEYDAYDNYFYGKKTDAVKKRFDEAWLHHIHNNPHHWQHWVLFEDDPASGESYKCIEMPFQYVVEMIADWWSFSWKKGNLYEIFDWYEDHRRKMKLHPHTRATVEDLLKAIKNKLEEQNYES